MAKEVKKRELGPPVHSIVAPVWKKNPDDPVILGSVPQIDGLEGHKVMVADQKRSEEEMAKVAYHSAEALVLAGLGSPSDPGLVATIAAVQCPGATGSVGWVTATKIEQAIKNYTGRK